METSPKLLARKVLLRIPKKLARDLEKIKGGDKINAKISNAVSKFYEEVVPADFKQLLPQGLSLREQMYWSNQARKLGFFPSCESPTRERVPFGTILSAETLECLKAITVWGGASRQSAVDACLAFYFQISGAPNPDQGQFSRFTYPLLSGSNRLTRHRLRWLVEYAIL